jgi:hypothetical protein
MYFVYFQGSIHTYFEDSKINEFADSLIKLEHAYDTVIEVRDHQNNNVYRGTVYEFIHMYSSYEIYTNEDGQLYYVSDMITRPKRPMTDPPRGPTVKRVRFDQDILTGSRKRKNQEYKPDGPKYVPKSVISPDYGIV